MKAHRTWTTILAYFRKIPIDKALINLIQKSLDNNENVLLMIKKENHELNPKYTSEEKHEELRKVFKDEIISNKLILSIVPDISSIINRRF